MESACGEYVQMRGKRSNHISVRGLIACINRQFHNVVQPLAQIHQLVQAQLTLPTLFEHTKKTTTVSSVGNGITIVKIICVKHSILLWTHLKGAW